MTRIRYIIVTEDTDMQARMLRLELEDAGWEIIRAHDSLSTLRVLAEASKRQQPIDAIALDLGLPPSKDSPVATGLPLAREIRNQYPGLPILAYTALHPSKFEIEQVIATLTPLRISFLNLRNIAEPDSLANLMEMVWRGFFLLSPQSADYLPRAIAQHPDPLDEDLWDTLRCLEKGYTYDEAASRMGLSLEGIRARLRRVSTALQAAGEIEAYETHRDDLLRWYRQNRVRYRRVSPHVPPNN
jgi:DNA-binding NarL/FixJ family response regulator